MSTFKYPLSLDLRRSKLTTGKRGIDMIDADGEVIAVFMPDANGFYDYADRVVRLINMGRPQL